MAEENSKKSNPKIYDVTKPDKVTPAATTKSIIVTNRPVLQDPMVVNSRMSGSGEGDPAVADTDLVPPSETRRRVQIYPFHDDTNGGTVSGAPEVKKTDTKKEADASKAADEPPVKLKVALPKEVEGTEISAPPVPELTPDIPKTADENSDKTEPKDKSPKPPTEVAADTSTAATPELLLEATTEHDAVKPAEETPATEEPVASQKTDIAEPEAVTAEVAEATNDQHLPGSNLAEGDSSAMPGINEKADKEAKKIEEEQEKIIESGTYSLPINAVGHRKAVRHIVLGIVLVIVLAVLLLLVALDAGVLTIPGFPAPTNYL